MVGTGLQQSNGAHDLMSGVCWLEIPDKGLRDPDLCIEALQGALRLSVAPEMGNTDS